MTGTASLAARAVLGVGLAGVGLAAVGTQRWRKASPAGFDHFAEWALVLSRLSFFVLLFLVAHVQPRGDVVAYYVPQGLSASHGLVVYRDFICSYAPLYPYVDGLLLTVWRSPLVLILFAILCECLALPLWLRLSRLHFSEERVRLATLLYLASPLSVVYVAVDGQNNGRIVLLVVLALLATERRRDGLSGALIGLSLVAVKFLPLLYVPSFWIALTKRLRWVVVIAAICVVGYGAFILLHAPVQQPFLYESNLRSANNLPYILQSISGIDGDKLPRIVGTLTLLSALAAAALATLIAGFRTVHADRIRISIYGIVLVTLALEIFSKKSWPPYLLLILFPLCLLIACDRQGKTSWASITVFSLFGIVAVLAPSVWATIYQEALPPVLHEMLAAGRPGTYLFLMLQITLVLGYFWLLFATLRAMFRPADGTSPELELGQ